MDRILKGEKYGKFIFSFSSNCFFYNICNRHKKRAGEEYKLLLRVFHSLFYTIYIYYLGTFVIAALFGIVYIVKKKTVRGEIAFSPFLLFSFYCILFMERV